MHTNIWAKEKALLLFERRKNLKTKIFPSYLVFVYCFMVEITALFLCGIIFIIDIPEYLIIYIFHLLVQITSHSLLLANEKKDIMEKRLMTNISRHK